MTTTAPSDILDYYRKNLAGRRHGGWRAVGDILGVNPGTAYGIAHGHRTITPDQDLRWHLYRNVDNPNVKVVRTLTCPSCGKLHRTDDCHGARLQIVRRKAPRRIQDMPVRELAWRIEHREEYS